MLQKYWIETLLISVLILSYLTSNKTMVISTLVVLALRVFKAEKALDALSNNGIHWGIVILTIGFLAPIALGKYDIEQLKGVFTGLEGIVSIICGILVAILGAKGVAAGISSVNITLGCVAGTVIGVALFKGNPVGPLIGSGMSICCITFINYIMGLF